MNAALRWERELELPGMVGRGRVLVCGGCGAILLRRHDGAPALEVGEHAPGCKARGIDYGQRELFSVKQ